MKPSSNHPHPVTITPPSAIKHWNEELFQVLTRVIDAVTYNEKPGMKIVMVAEYLSRASRIEIPALMHEGRRPRRKATGA
jgi:hypothetical protein